MKFQKRQTKASPGDYVLTILPLSSATASLATAKKYLIEGDSTDQDAIITALIRGAVQQLESGLDFAIDSSGLIYQYYDGFPTDGVLQIWHRYIKSADLVVEYWNDTAWTTVSSSVYRTDLAATPPMVFLKSDQDWPTGISDDTLNTVRIGFKFDTAHSFIDELRAAAMTLVAANFENREGGVDIPKRVQAFIDKHKMHS